MKISKVAAINMARQLESKEVDLKAVELALLGYVFKDTEGYVYEVGSLIRVALGYIYADKDHLGFEDVETGEQISLLSIKEIRTLLINQK